MMKRHVPELVLAAFVALVFLGRSIVLDPRVADTREHAATAEEVALTETIRQHALALIAHEAKPDGLYKRDAHKNPHGCVTAEFRVRPDLPPELRQGVFAEPGKRYPAWVRFSNGVQGDDTKPDGRGMAIKLMGVPGEKLLENQKQELTQDFVMLNHPTFLVRDVAEYLEFFDKQSKGEDFGYFIGWNPAHWHLREMRIGLEMLTQKVPSPLATTYFSMLPFKHGEALNVKYSAMPCDLEKPEHCEVPERDMPEELSPHYLRDALVKDLRPRSDAATGEELGARFAFRVQVQKDGANMPIEDASIEWDEAASPYVEVAELTIMRQRFDSQLQNEFCENLSFTPWHALPAHRPIGQLNRARRVMYEAISERRHQANGVRRVEPRDFNIGASLEVAAVQPGVAP